MRPTCLLWRVKEQSRNSRTMTENEEFVASLQEIVGNRQVLTTSTATRSFRTGFRGGSGSALAVVRPGSLLEMWRVLQQCVKARKAVLMQAANTGLTGGSTPDQSVVDRDVVIINAMRINRIFLIDGGRQVICLPGVTLRQLERTLARLGREPHSVLGSSCFGATVVGGVCNNSGGSLVRRGPAYTEMALFAQITPDWQLCLVNHLGARMGAVPEEALARLERGEFELVREAHQSARQGSDGAYASRVREISCGEPSRYNEDPRRLFEASGCAGKLAVFAVRVDTFAKDRQTRVFYIGTNEAASLSRLRRTILKEFETLPVSAEYIHRTAFDVAERYGKDIFLAIRLLGTDALPILRSLHEKMQAMRGFLGLRGKKRSWSPWQSLLQALPSHLPLRMRSYRHRFEHHLILKMPDDGIGEARAYLQAAAERGDVEAFECTSAEAEKAFLHRFVVAGAAMRLLEVERLGISSIVPLDVALLPDDERWSEFEPRDLHSEIHTVVPYGHFLCHVFHLDYILRPEADSAVVKKRLMAWLDVRGARYPAEHNVGRLYRASPALEAFYRALDPTNSFNPGVGQTSTRPGWAEG